MEKLFNKVLELFSYIWSLVPDSVKDNKLFKYFIIFVIFVFVIISCVYVYFFN